MDVDDASIHVPFIRIITVIMTSYITESWLWLKYTVNNRVNGPKKPLLSESRKYSCESTMARSSSGSLYLK